MLVKGRTSAYVRAANGEWHVDIPNYDTYGATSLFTTVGDLLKWQENFRHPVVGDDALLRTMQTSAVLANGDTTGYGFGLTVGEERGMRVVGHGGADAGYRSYTGRFPEQAFAVAVLCNAGPSNPSALASSVSAVFLKGTEKPSPSPVAATTKPTAQELARWAGVYVNPATLNVTYLTVRDADLIVGRTSGPTLVPIAGGRFWFPAQRTEWALAPNGDLVLTFRGTPPRTAVTLVRRQPSHPSRADLANYVGTYFSEELRATYTVSATDTALTLRTQVTEPWTAMPVYGEMFSGRASVEFTRDQNGRVTGALMSTGRTRRIRFEKKP
jgi:hypothetical protein